MVIFMIFNRMDFNFLSMNDPEPVTLINKDSHSQFLFVCDHAGSHIPEQLNELGLEKKDRYRHIALDIGIREVGEKLANLLNSTLVLQNYSRLVIDCNRCLEHETLIAKTSDKTVINGNQNLSDEEKKNRIITIFQPYHDTIEQLILERQKRKQSTIFIALHSFTPTMNGIDRPWHAGILHNQHPEFALIFKKILEEHYSHPIGNNEPYALTEKNDYSVPFHAIKRELPYLELEIRQDLITTEQQQQEWADRLEHVLLLTLKEYQAR